jgi:pimeloyl-ACP methyl ester carboxylesterase
MAAAEIAYTEVAGRPIAYRFRPGAEPTLLFLPGYASDMEGGKALAIDAYAEQHGLAILRFDYSGTGSSKGRFEDGTLSSWLDESLALVDRLTTGPLIVIGSSMGGWIGLHLALRRAERVRALIGIASAPDFTEWGFSAEQKAELEEKGRIEEPNPYAPEPQVFTRDFWRSGQELRLLEEYIDVECPVRLIHGDSDEEVPVEVAQRTMSRLRSGDVQLLTIKGGGHRLSEPHEIEAILRTLSGLLEQAE